MGLSSFPSAAAGGVLPVLAIHAILSVALLKNMVRSVLQVMFASWAPSDYEEEPDGCPQENARERRISTTQFKTMNQKDGSAASGRTRTMECRVCLCGFEAEEEVSELSCKHFFHKGCLDKWFDKKQTTCPLCRSIL